MRFGINTIDEFELSGKTVLCRVDMNQPVDRATDSLRSTQRIEACAPTLKELSDKGAKVVVMAHQGSDIEYQNFYCTRPHAKVLSSLIGKEVKWVEDVCGPTAREAIAGMKDGEILLLDNVRFCSEEQTLFELKLKLTHEEQAKTQVVSKLAPLGDLYVCDAFAAAHRDQPTLCGFEQVLPSAMGRLFEKIGQKSVDFIYAKNYEDYIPKAAALYEKYGDRIVLPVDLGGVEEGKRVEYTPENVPDDFSAIDIGAETIRLYCDAIANAKTVFVNGPMGVFEESLSEAGTKKIFEALGDTKAYTVVGGGDSVTAAKKYKVTDQLGYVCTGGGALIRFLTGEELPVVKALRYAAKAFPVPLSE